MRRREMGEEVEPAVGLINLADIMLVFATGLMMALVTFWNIDIGPQVSEIIETSAVTEVSDLEEAKDLLQSGGSAYSEVGTVYKDPETGKLYMLTEDVESAGGTSSDAPYANGGSTADESGDTPSGADE
jgi:hypothetical protein